MKKSRIYINAFISFDENVLVRRPLMSQNNIWCNR